jgi:hypothetical protein
MFWLDATSVRWPMNSLNQVAAKRVKQLMNWFGIERRLDSNWRMLATRSRWLSLSLSFAYLIISQ